MRELRWEERLGTYDSIIFALIVTDNIYLTASKMCPEWAEQEGEDAIKVYRGLSINEWPYCTIVLNRSGEYNGLNSRTIAHEALHTTTYVLDTLGIPISRENDEAMTYLQDYIIGRINIILAKHRIPVTPYKFFVDRPAPKMTVTKLHY